VQECLKRILDQKGFSKSESSDQLLENYKRDSDTVKLFIEEEGYEKSVDVCVPINNLYKEYQSFCEVGSYNPIARRIFNNRLRNLGYQIERKHVIHVVHVAKNQQ
jgi:putative DNA primase/helicase